MASWIYNPIKEALSFQSNSGLLPGIPIKQQTGTGIEPPAPKFDTRKQSDEQSFIDGGEFFGLLLIATIAGVWLFFRKRQ